MMSQPRKKQLEVQEIGDVTVVNFTMTKILDEQVIQSIGDQLYSLVDELGKTKVVLNFSKVEYLSSAALGKLITLHKKLVAAKGKLALCNIDLKIAEVFDITGLRRVFKIFNDEQEALQSM
jgi:anti-sigma B factor antagonist